MIVGFSNNGNDLFMTRPITEVDRIFHSLLRDYIKQHDEPVRVKAKRIIELNKPLDVKVQGEDYRIEGLVETLHERYYDMEEKRENLKEEAKKMNTELQPSKYLLIGGSGIAILGVLLDNFMLANVTDFLKWFGTAAAGLGLINIYIIKNENSKLQELKSLTNNPISEYSSFREEARLGILNSLRDAGFLPSDYGHDLEWDITKLI
jgi:hypothetical protein